MNFNSIDVLKSALGQFFSENFYTDAVTLLRKALKEDKYYNENWYGVIQLIVKKELQIGEPLNLMDNDANLPLEENSDEEAYKWLTLMIINSVGQSGSPIIDYADLFKPTA